MLTYEKYSEYRDKKKLTNYYVSLRTGISNSTFSDWKNGRYEPSLKTQLKLAKLLNIPIKAIVSKEDIENAELCPKDSG